MLIKGQMVANERGNLYATITNKGLVLETEHNRNDEELYSFEMVEVLVKVKLFSTLIPIRI